MAHRAKLRKVLLAKSVYARRALIPVVACLCTVLRQAPYLALSTTSSGPAFLSPRDPSQQGRVARRQVLGSAVAGWGVPWLMQPVQADAVGPRPIKRQDLARIKKGYEELLYLQANWNKVTRICDSPQAGKVEYSLPSGVLSPDACTANPDVVRAYLGNRSLLDNLYATDRLWIDIEAADFVPEKDEDRFQEATDNFERYKRDADAWAFTSSWGEANPGGGRDKVEDFLLRSKFDVDRAIKNLGVIVEILEL